MDIINVTDLPTALRQIELIEVMVAGANAKATRVAPCLATTDPAPSSDKLAEAKLILLGAVKRWAEAGAGALQTQNAGPFGMTVDTRQRTGFNLWPTEITDLQAICSGGPVERQAFSLDTAPSRANGSHIPWCSIFLGEPCSCGSSINGHEGPLYEFGYGLDYI